MSSAEELGQGARVVLCRSDLYRRRRVDSFIPQRHGTRCTRRSMPNREVRKRARFVKWNFGGGTIECLFFLQRHGPNQGACVVLCRADG